jgi:trans-aconitate 2-methyltransferase
VSAPPRARDWDARSYDRVSGPQVEFALPLLDRLALDGRETVLDAGCGSGRVTALLLERLAHGAVVAADAAPSMVAQARERFAAEPRVRVLDPVSLTDLEVAEPVDAVFSNAVLHWIADHDAVFRRLHAALRPGGRLVAQCGGTGNIDRFRRLAEEVAAEPPFAAHMAGFEGPWNYAGPAETERRLRAAGFEDVRTWLEPHPVRPSEPVEYALTVCLGSHAVALPDDLREPYAAEVVRRCGRPLVLDYVRLNIDARRP